MNEPAEQAATDTIEFDDDGTHWRFERSFLTSNWTCLWGRGCLGILDEPAEHLNQGCCSVGAEMGDATEAMTVTAFAAMLEPSRFQHHAEASTGVLRDVVPATPEAQPGWNTRVVDGACIFLNRPGFAGGEGCALHLAAVDHGESPTEWKPSVCWQLPVRIEWDPNADGTETATLRRWSRQDWGTEGETMSWCCTEGDRAYVGDRPVIESLADELEAMLGPTVFVELRRRVTEIP